MEIIGIIAEYNPFHNGHLYHINKIKEMYKDSFIVVVLSGYFTQRGEISVLTKWDKADIILDYGVDLVVELPFNYSTQSAENFAYGAVSILNMLGCTHLVFGSESNDIDNLISIAKKMSGKKYNDLINKNMNIGNSYPKAISNTLKKLNIDDISTPNDILGIEYIKSINKLKSNMIPITIKRTNDYHDKNINSVIASASSIRNNINNIDKIKDTMPKESLNKLINISIDNLFDILKYQINTDDNLNLYKDVDEGIENKLKKEINNVDSIKDLINNIKSKRYTYNRLNRMFIHIITKHKKEDSYKDIKYLRILGMNNNGKNILNTIKKKTNIPIISKYKKEYNELLKEDIKITGIYSQLIKDKTLIDREYKSSIIK
ncbi:MAG TPA: nucleotidyltransferase [Bacilli bacterium]|nr:nucleotidyltransferase [Bacilli bacterium]